MCGIAGFVNSQHKVDEQIVRILNKAIEHRGPDSDGYFISDNVGLTIRRLSIIDVAGGDQPIYNEDDSVLIMLNGEIYNYASIREELIKLGHQMKTKSDTEVILHGYEQWGIDGILDKIEGMFGFVIYDKNTNKLYVARDRFGEKSIYYYHKDGELLFASELKAILATGKVALDINPTALFHYLALHYSLEHRSMISGVHRLLAGHYMQVDVATNSLTTHKYWELKENISLRSDSYEVAKDHVRNEFTKIVENRMIGEVPVGAFLSGGIDSSIMVGLMSRFNKDLMTFSVGFNSAEFDESSYSQEVAKLYKTNHHHFTFSEDEALSHLPEVVKFLDEPSGDQAFLPVFLLSREARKYVTVALGGEGADEIFGGYDYYQQFMKPGTLMNLRLMLHGDLLREKVFETASGFSILTRLSERSELMTGDSFAQAQSELQRQPLRINSALRKIINPLRRAQYTDVYSWLVDDLLIKYDRMAMANSLEGRAPYLDSKLASYVFNLPSDYKIRNGVSKAILRDAFADLLPDSIFKRKKHGFNLPMAEWLRGKLKATLLASAELEQNDLINPEKYKAIIAAHLSGKEDRARLLYSIMMYRLWYQHITKQ